MNRWNIPNEVEAHVKSRDLACVYCHSPFSDKSGPYRNRASWEHVINDLTLVTAENIVLCCIACNASKGAKKIEIWLTSSYCKNHGITAETVSPIVRKSIKSSG